MATRQHLLSTDDIAGTLADYEVVLLENERLLVLVEDLREQLRQSRHPTVPAETVRDQHPADVIPR